MTKPTVTATILMAKSTQQRGWLTCENAHQRPWMTMKKRRWFSSSHHAFLDCKMHPFSWKPESPLPSPNNDVHSLESLPSHAHSTPSSVLAWFTAKKGLCPGWNKDTHHKSCMSHGLSERSRVSYPVSMWKGNAIASFFSSESNI